MPPLEFDISFPFPTGDLGLSLGVRAEPVALREFALLVSPRDAQGSLIPKGLINWGFSAPLGGCYQYIPASDPDRSVTIGLPLLSELPMGSVHVTVVAWKPVIPGTQPRDIFDQLVVTFSAYSTEDVPSLARFSTVRRSIHA